MRLLFCGTPPFAVPALKHLLAQSDFEILAAITQPDRPRGRGQEVSFSAVKEVALAANLAVHQPEKIRGGETEALLRKLAPDCIVIIAYGQIIPARLLPIPKLGWINLHASLLPKYRGAAPINWAIVNGETRTGVTTMRIDAGMDTGEMLLQREVEISAKETAPELATRLSELGAPLMAETLRGLAAGTITPKAQNHSEASYAPMLKREDGRIDWNQPTFRGQSCHVWGEAVSKEGSVSLPSSPKAAGPGTLLFEKTQLFVWCGDATVLRVRAVKLEGRKQVSAPEFANGSRLKSGERFGDT